MLIVLINTPETILKKWSRGPRQPKSLEEGRIPGVDDGESWFKWFKYGLNGQIWVKYGLNMG